jgi:hypothetical protein
MAPDESTTFHLTHRANADRNHFAITTMSPIAYAQYEVDFYP